jgi:hypothetical protein
MRFRKKENKRNRKKEFKRKLNLLKNKSTYLKESINSLNWMAIEIIGRT